MVSLGALLALAIDLSK